MKDEGFLVYNTQFLTKLISSESERILDLLAAYLAKKKEDGSKPSKELPEEDVHHFLIRNNAI